MNNTSTARECALNSCKNIDRITGLGLKLVQRSDKKIDLLCDGRMVDSWKSWEESRIALWSSFLIVEAAFMENVLLADIAVVERRLAVAEKKLAETTAELTSVRADRDLFQQVAVRFAQIVDLGAGGA
jgi:hypothetical protein